MDLRTAKLVGVICTYEWIDPFEQRKIRSSCFIKVYTSDQIVSRFKAAMDKEGRASAVMTSYLTENGRAKF